MCDEVLTAGWVLVSSGTATPVSMGGVGMEESAWVSGAGGLAPRGERTVTLGRRLGVFFMACRAEMETLNEFIVFLRNLRN